MRIPRIYTPQPLDINTTIILDKAAAQHIVKVLRLRPPQALILFNNSNDDYQANLEQINKQVIVKITKIIPNCTSSPLTSILMQGLSRAERMDYTIQKAVELGIDQIIPIQTERSVVKLNDKRLKTRHQHWLHVIQSACEQCGRSLLPQLHETIPLSMGLQHPNIQQSQRLLLDHQAQQSLLQIQPQPKVITLLVGPEGGFSDSEKQQAQQAHFQGIYLGPRILRTETAALSALSIMQTLWGDLGI